MPTAPDVDFSDLTLKEVRQQIGQLVEVNLRNSRIAILVAREGGVVTILDPKVLTLVPPEELAGYLLEHWEDEHISSLLEHLDTLREKT